MAKTSAVALAALLAGALTLTGCELGTANPPEGARSSAAAESVSAAPQDGSASPAAAQPRPKDFTDTARGIVAKMDYRALAGAVIMGSYSGTDARAGAQLISSDRLAGIIVMPDNLPPGASRPQVSQITSTLAKAAGTRGWQALIGVDQEGGPVTRAGGAALELPPLMAHGAADDPALTTQITRLQGQDLRQLGFTIDFAPVADVTAGAQDPGINVRSAGDDPAHVSSIVEAAVSGYDAAGILSSLKHFPGHGGVTVDSHKGLPVSKIGLSELADRDGVPFADAAKAGNAPAMMVGHIALPDDPKLPSSLNPKAYTALRDTVGFDGLIVTDALNMEAVSAGKPGQETVRALAAGADLALLPPDSAAAAEAVRTALRTGTLERKRLEESATRVVAAQLWQSAMAKQQPVGGDGGGNAAGSADAAGSTGAAGATDAAGSTGAAGATDAAGQQTKLAEGSLTVLAGQCRFAEPVSEVKVTGSKRGVEAFTAAAKQAGLRVSPQAKTEVALVPGPLQGSATVRQAKARNSTRADVAVAMAGPWVLRDYSSPTQLAVYDDWKPGLAAVARYLRGELAATGSAPVKTPGVKPPACR